MNLIKTGMLLAAMTALFIAVGYVIGGQSGAMMAFLVAAAMNFIGYWNADKMVLRMNNAVQVDARTAPEFYHLVERLAAQANLPMPKVYIVNEDQPNAFATGRNPQNAAVAATTGLLRTLNEDEVAGVMAHELAHIQNRDTLIMTVAATFAGAISMLGNFAFMFGGNRDNNNGGGGIGILGTLIAIIVAPLAAMLVQMAVSRTREYSADKRGAQISGDPDALASALRKISSGAANHRNAAAEANPAMAHMYIANPLHGERMDNLFSTHPNVNNRIQALEAMRQAGGMTGARPSGRAMPVQPRGEQAPVNDGGQQPGPWGGQPSRSEPQERQPQSGPWGRKGGNSDPWS